MEGSKGLSKHERHDKRGSIIKLSSLTYIITKLISLVIKVVNEIIMIRLLFIIY